MDTLDDEEEKSGKDNSGLSCNDNKDFVTENDITINIIYNTGTSQINNVALAPYNDNLLWCVGCKKSVRPNCRKHGHLQRVKDRKIVSRARLTIPHLMTIKLLDYKPAGKHEVGVFVRKVLQKNIQFGPYEGILDFENYPADDQLGLPLHLLTKDGRCMRYDSSDENLCNWMVLVRPASYEEEQNLAAYQYRNEIFFVTTKPVALKEELRVWYADNYAKAIGAKTLAELNTPKKNKQEEIEENPDLESTITATELSFDGGLSDGGFEEEGKASFFQGSPISDQGEVDNESDDPSYEPQRYIKGMETEKGIEMGLLSSVIDQDTVRVKTEAGRRTKSKRKVRPVKVKVTGEQANGEHVKVDVRDENLASANNTSSIVTRQKRRRGCPAKLKDPDFQVTLRGQRDRKKKSSSQVDNKQTKKTAIKKEKKTVKKGKLFLCDLCGKAFSSKAHLDQHNADLHLEQRRHICPVENCGKAFSTQYMLKRHQLTHGKEKKYECSLCSRTFNRQDHLKQHIKIHNPNKQVHKCDRCGREYKSFSAFRYHMAFHKVEDGSTHCLVCSESFDSKDEIVIHLKKHMGARSVMTGEKKCKCPYCPKTFYMEKEVKRHIVVHTRVKEFLCQFCPQAFGRKDHLSRHLIRAHPTEEQPEINKVCRILPESFKPERKFSGKAKTLKEMTENEFLNYAASFPTNTTQHEQVCSRLSGVDDPPDDQEMPMAAELSAANLLSSLSTQDHDYQVAEIGQNQTTMNELNSALQTEQAQPVVTSSVQGSDNTTVLTRLQQLEPPQQYNTVGLTSIMGGNQSGLRVLLESPAQPIIPTVPVATESAKGPDHQYSVNPGPGEKMNVALNMLASQVAQDRISYSEALRVLGSMPGVTQITVTPVAEEQQKQQKQQALQQHQQMQFLTQAFPPT